MVVHLVYFSVFWLNSPPTANGINEVFSSREIVTRHIMDFKPHCKANFEQYVKGHIEPDITNDMKEGLFWYCLFGVKK